MSVMRRSRQTDSVLHKSFAASQRPQLDTPRSLISSRNSRKRPFCGQNQRGGRSPLVPNHAWVRLLAIAVVIVVISRSCSHGLTIIAATFGSCTSVRTRSLVALPVRMIQGISGASCPRRLLRIYRRRATARRTRRCAAARRRARVASPSAAQPPPRVWNGFPCSGCETR